MKWRKVLMTQNKFHFYDTHAAKIFSEQYRYPLKMVINTVYIKSGSLSIFKFNSLLKKDRIHSNIKRQSIAILFVFKNPAGYNKTRSGNFLFEIASTFRLSEN
jgi:hypothetical protein